MPKCVDCKHEGKYFNLKVPFPIGGVTLVGFEEEARKRGFTKEDLPNKGMHCQAPGGGPTKDPIVLVQAIADQPCSYFSPKKRSKKTTSTGEKKKSWWQFRK